MKDGKLRILAVLKTFTGRDGEPQEHNELYILKSMWLMMLSEFEASIKAKVERYIDRIKSNNISDIHVCLLVRNFFGNSSEDLTLNKIVSYYKKNPSDITYSNFTRDRIPKYKTDSVVKLFSHLGIFFSEAEHANLLILNSIASTRDSIAHGDIGVQITRKELENHLDELEHLLSMLENKLK